MPLRLDNAKCVAHMPTAEQQQQKNKPVEPRFKIDHAASPMPETRQPERLAPRATSNRNGGRDHLGILGEIKSVHPGETIGIRSEGEHQISVDGARLSKSGSPARGTAPLVVSCRWLKSTDRTRTLRPI